jgi:hypothetical protein
MTLWSNRIIYFEFFLIDKWCPMIWDGALCWPHTQFNKIAQQKCPDYVVGFNHNSMKIFMISNYVNEIRRNIFR